MSGHFYKITTGWITLLLILFIHCSDRERSNPLDPQNPKTGGAVKGLRIFAQKNLATLTWIPMDINSVENYVIYKSCNDYSLAKYDSVPYNQHQYLDEQITYDNKYYYAVQTVTKFDKSKLSDTVSVVPGQYYFIMADYYGQSLLKFSYDCNTIIKYYDLYSPTAVVVVNNDIYFTNLWDMSFKMLDSFGSIRSINLDQAPVDFAFNDSKDQFYILLRENNNLAIYNLDGIFIEKIDLPIDLTFYSSCAYDLINDCLWITDKQFDKIYKYDLKINEMLTVLEDIQGPEEIIIDNKNGGCWIATLEGILYIESSGEIHHFLSDYYIYDFSFDDFSHTLYYCGFSTDKDEWNIGTLKEGNHTILYKNYLYITNIKVVPETSGNGLILIQGNTGRVIRINAKGEEIGTYSSVYGIVDIELQ